MTLKIKMQFDCIIPTSGRDCFLVRKSIPLIIEYLKPQKIYIITRKAYFIYFSGYNKNKIVLIDENELIENINFSMIEKFLVNAKYSPKSAGWYFQQFLKMGFALSSYADKYYLSWDADTFPIRPINFFSELEIPYFTMKEEYHEPYFITLKRILNLNKINERSFISENMLFETEIMKGMIFKIDESGLQGDSWCEIIINSLPKDRNNSFSEFETYGTYVQNYFPDHFVSRELKTFRNAGLICPRFISKKQMIKFSKEYDMISLEYRHNPKYPIKIISLIQKLVIKKNNQLLDILQRK